jgi:hypothetical protein
MTHAIGHTYRRHNGSSKNQLLQSSLQGTGPGFWVTRLRFCQQGGYRALPVCTENLNPNIVVMKPAEDRV